MKILKKNKESENLIKQKDVTFRQELDKLMTKQLDMNQESSKLKSEQECKYI